MQRCKKCQKCELQIRWVFLGFETKRMEELCRTRNIILYGDCFYVLLFGIIHTLNGSVVTLSIHVVGEM
jgi:hypothetical protein